MIPSIDTYLHDEIKCKLQIILSNRYIIEEILKGIQPSIAANFMKVYTGDNAREIPIVYTMPQDKQSLQGAIYIGLREGEETNNSIGNVEDTYDYSEGNLNKELSRIMYTPNKDRMYMEVSKPIGELVNVENLSFAKSDNVSIEGNRVYFNYEPELENLEPFKINYIEKSGDDMGVRIGFMTTEHYSVLVVSTNMDTVRCLDLIVKAILILMRNNPDELNTHLLQHIQFGQLEEMNIGSEEQPEILYGRESTVSYRISYNLEVPILQKLKEINVKLK